MENSVSSRRWGVVALLVCSSIWGFAFSAQSLGMNYMGPCGFNALRSVIGGLALIPGIALLDCLNKRKPSFWGDVRDKVSRRALCLGGILSGLTLGVASLLQQVGLLYSTAGKAGFLTALYIILVPIIGAFLKHRTSPLVWFAALVALYGMSLLCNVSWNGGLQAGDWWLIGCAAGFALQILVVAKYVCLTDCVRLSCLQFFVAALVSAIAFPFTSETISWSAVCQGWGPLLFCGVMSSGVAYTLQNVGEKYVHPVVATLVMSLESVFSAIGGWLILHEELSRREVLGCALIFAAVILAQVPLPKKRLEKVE
ncbi:MAG: DMT family transporter [Lentisphaeria bacterium]|nr:DMT family transporter [Lentisphaeria bacterium]